MGLLRKSVLIGTGGLAPIKANSKKERTAKAAEKQLKVQQQMLREQQRANDAVAVRPAAPTRIEAAPGEYRIVLLSAGDKKIQVIKVVREATGWDLKQAKAFVDHAPSSLLLPRERVAGLETALRQAGATTETEPPAEVAEAPTATQAQEAVPGPASMAGELEHLAELRDRGVLTDEEFSAAKSRILG